DFPHIFPALQSTVVEEEDEGVIYTVVVKQQHASPNSPASSLPVDFQSTVSRSQCVKAGTEEKLVLHLLHSFSLGDSSFISIFLSTYRSFTSTERVLDILIDSEFQSLHCLFYSVTKLVKLLVYLSVLYCTWLSEYPEDFRNLGDPSRLLRLAPLLPQDSSSAVDLRARLLRTAEELRNHSVLSASADQSSSSSPPPDPSKFEPTSVLGFPAAVIAEQLTKIETELFVRLVPYHCLGSLWSQRDKKGREGVCWSVRATIRQFNKLANAVLASCLWPTKLRSQQRARLLEKWISVAEECRARKNFSSLYAVVSALQSNPIHRLRRTWQETDSREALRRYEELAEIFSDKDNYSQSRELLKEEGTSKFANLDNRINNRHHSRGIEQQSEASNAQGTVPYLGIFLTDLTMLDTAVKDRLDNGYINFDKRRREFEVLAQIRLLQSSCKNCVFDSDEAFSQWYHSVPTLTEEQSYRLSNEIEAPTEPSPRSLMPTVIITQCSDKQQKTLFLKTISFIKTTYEQKYNIYEHRGKSGSQINLINKLGSNSQLKEFSIESITFSPNSQRKGQHMRSPSVSCLDVDTSPPTNESTPVALTPTTPTKTHRRSASCGNNLPSNVPGSGPDMRIIRIRMDLQDGNLYRSILVTSNDKTPSVISSALEKHNQDPTQASRYELIQLLPEGKELVIPATGNVFYAMTSSSVDFLLRRKGGNTPVGSPITTETSATFPRIKAKGRRLVRTLF
uniref:Ral guanine nucleotide dissociation stimulator-like 2 n=1 Tax=Poecilia formosa TaxID=48698 RepID=A0A096LQ52_POEFO